MKKDLDRQYALLKSLQVQLDDVMTRDRYRLTRQLREVNNLLLKATDSKKQDKPSFDAKTSSRIEKLKDHFERSLKLCKLRQATIPTLSYPEELPISSRRADISDAIQKHQVVILAGETGSGKTTQLPKICLELGRGVKGVIGHTQPRRIAARTVATRIAEELNTSLGNSVGYQVRFNDHTKETTHIKLMTDGILLAEVQHDRFLSRYDTLIIDEAHERSLNIDFLLGFLKQLLPKRPDLKLIITSATIDLERFSKHFNDAPIIEVSGRTYPVTTHYRPLGEEFDDQFQAITEVVGEIISTEKGTQRGGDILVFLSGERDIRETAKSLRDANYPQLEIIPLYARLSVAEQNKIFKPSRGRRVVLSTNVAETSLTVPGIRYVVDPGFARISRYSYRSKIQRLPIEPISQASANQRMGRCGRVSEGVCYRLYDENDFDSRPVFTDAEIMRTNLAAVILQMLNLRIGDIRDFPFVDKPDQRFINDGFKLLQELQAVDSNSKLTKLGRQIMSLPVDPKLGRMILAAAPSDCIHELLIIVSALSVQDPRERPSDRKQASDEKHRRFKDDHSDFMAYVNLWNYVEEQRQTLSSNQWRKQCKREFLSYLRLREWRDLYHQLLLAIKPLSININTEPANYEAIHRALLPGLLGQVCKKTEAREYLGARNQRLNIFPGSSQAKNPPKWIMSAQILETSKVFAHQVAKIEPTWAMDAAEHLLQRQQFEPHYHIKSGQVKAFERVSLYGLVLAEKIPINYSQIDPIVSREIFIRAAFVEGHYEQSMKARRKHNLIGKFFIENKKLINSLVELEAKSRRRDILVNDEDLFDFFDQHIPDHIHNIGGFEHWRKKSEISTPKLLHLTREYLMQHDASSITDLQFPNTLEHDGLTFNLSYHFEPNHPADGVSIQVPVAALHLLPEKKLEWLIPGILREKCIAIIKALPKQWRKNFVPVPNYVDKVLAVISPDNSSLYAAIGHQLKRLSMVEVPKKHWEKITLDDYYLFNIQVIDSAGKVIEQSRDLALLREKYRNHLQKALKNEDDPFERMAISSWDFGTLDDTVQLERAGMSITAYPALVDNGKDIDLKLRDNPIQAKYEMERALCRLAMINLTAPVKYLRKELLKGSDIGLSVVNLGSREQVAEDIIMASIRQCCFTNLVTLTNDSNSMSKRLPKTSDEFDVCLSLGKEKIISHAQETATLLISVLRTVVEIKKTIKSSKNALVIAVAAADINSQLRQLIYHGFIFETPENWFKQYPRYLNAILLRLEKVPAQTQRDKVWTQEIELLSSKLYHRIEKEGKAIVFNHKSLVEYRWMLEEYRVSLFAQTLKTLKPVSTKRLNKLWLSCK